MTGNSGIFTLGNPAGRPHGGRRQAASAQACQNPAVGAVLASYRHAIWRMPVQSAAKKGKANWSTAGKDGKKATYQKVGAVEDMGGKKCQKVKETITLADGKQGTSTETVCFG